ncbi:MAG TPA: hypothetical protein VG389_20955 [Myxococcota bacterium]|jgi:hypothetical protein|nr:hypothetical protein [Myxococcota bacterium]
MMRKPFDSKVEWTRDDAVPVLEFRYRGTRLSPLEGLATILLTSMIFTAPLALIPLIRSRAKRRHVRLDRDTLTVGKHQYERRLVQRVRTVAFTLSNARRLDPGAAGTTAPDP